MKPYLPRSVELLFLAVLVIGAVVLTIRHPDDVIRDAGIPAVVIAAYIAWRWWQRR